MGDLATLPLVSCDEDWLELGDGERCVLRGRLYGRLRPGDGSLMVSMTSWEVIAVTIPGGYAGLERPAGAVLVVTATRTEDGIDAGVADITINEED